MRWMQRHSRIIAATALAAMLLPFAASALSTATAIPSIYWAVILFVAVAGLIGWRAWRGRGEQDEED